jgi:3-oxoacyl-[acyl-carrier protein] reductase
MALLKDHIAVVTGSASGIGRAIAAGYAREGARVVLLDVN